jgi:hypothetical protein
MKLNQAPRCGQCPYMPALAYSVVSWPLPGFYVSGLFLRTPGGGPCGHSFGSWSQPCFLTCWDFSFILLCANRSRRLARTAREPWR